MHDLPLRYFHSVARTGSLSAAAEELHVAVSAVSRQISNLEENLGLQLFERKPRGMQLTEPGEVLLAYANRNQLEVRNVIAEMRGLNTLQQHTITLACPEGMAWEFLPRVCAQFRAFHPGASFDLQVVDAARASQLVKDGVADIALTFSLTPTLGVEISLSCDSPISALMPVSHPLASSESLTVQELAQYPLALPHAGSTIRYLFDIACNLHSMNIVPAYASHSLGAIYNAVRHSTDVIALCGAATVSGTAARDNLLLVPMSDPQLRQRSLQVQIMAGRKLPVLIRYFLSFLEEQLVSVSQPPEPDTPTRSSRSKSGPSGFLRNARIRAR
ncbi:LysR family transcriptional regulator [Pseudomonas sp. LJDD11]|uniref:LysR family transcriptional regulator n=1 Tax=unclassified Pseudomonas TaxID=196821 RepID=UPI0004F58AF8|nr:MULTISPECIES: LysR family transcriptional regulator [unclassified Pseudomonas]MCO8163922.1 LysR family transcriptional regulator [Pseudomonas sp. 21LCFQ010]MCQ9421919.1 LysR family transcriptional regulator [Pseudomonas sp. LJDD11]BAP41774.1 transcriptional regulator, LysR family [Pseudomonas sp. StFLB209]